MYSIIHSYLSKSFSRLHPQWSFQNTHRKMSHTLFLKPLNAFPLCLGQSSNSLMVHKTYYGQNLLWSDAYLHITLPNSTSLPSVPRHHAPSHPRARALHTLPILSQLVPTHPLPFFFFGLFLKNIYSNSTVLISLIALIVAIYLHFCVWLFDPCLSPSLDCKHIRILDVLDHVVSPGLHSVLPQKRCQ